jgi:hypothetical protein
MVMRMFKYELLLYSDRIADEYTVTGIICSDTYGHAVDDIVKAYQWEDPDGKYGTYICEIKITETFDEIGEHTNIYEISTTKED